MATPDIDDDNTGEIEIDPDLSFIEWRRSVSRALNRQAKIEAERAGAQKATARLVALFGSLITAAAIGGFTWLWDTQSTTQAQGAQLAQVSEVQRLHGRKLDEHDTDLRSVERRVSAAENATKNTNDRIDQQQQTLQTILEEVRRGRRWR